MSASEERENEKEKERERERENENENGRSKRKKVCWPPDDKLLQVLLFAAEDAPCLSGAEDPDIYRAKQVRLRHVMTPFARDDLPPGFEGVVATMSKLDAQAMEAMLPQTLWQCPTKFAYDPLWQVVAGEESEEANFETQREVRLLEAVYPRTSVIPSSPAEPNFDTKKKDNIGQSPLQDVSETKGHFQDVKKKDDIARIPLQDTPKTEGHFQDAKKKDGIAWISLQDVPKSEGHFQDAKKKDTIAQIPSLDMSESEGHFQVKLHEPKL